MLRIEPSIDGSRTDGDDINFDPPVGEDWTRCLIVRVPPELDVRAKDGEGEGEDIAVDR
jgi:hypothetical protein